MLVYHRYWLPYWIGTIDVLMRKGHEPLTACSILCNVRICCHVLPHIAICCHVLPMFAHDIPFGELRRFCEMPACPDPACKLPTRQRAREARVPYDSAEPHGATPPKCCYIKSVDAQGPHCVRPCSQLRTRRLGVAYCLFEKATIACQIAVACYFKCLVAL